MVIAKYKIYSVVYLMSSQIAAKTIARMIPVTIANAVSGCGSIYKLLIGGRFGYYGLSQISRNKETLFSCSNSPPKHHIGSRLPAETVTE
jgi:uncharacterized protein YceK